MRQLFALRRPLRSGQRGRLALGAFLALVLGLGLGAGLRAPVVIQASPAQADSGAGAARTDASVTGVGTAGDPACTPGSTATGAVALAVVTNPAF